MLTARFGSPGAVSGERREGALADFGRNSALTVGLVEDQRENGGRPLVGLVGRWHGARNRAALGRLAALQS